MSKYFHRNRVAGASSSHLKDDFFDKYSEDEGAGKLTLDVNIQKKTRQKKTALMLTCSTKNICTFYFYGNPLGSSFTSLDNRAQEEINRFLDLTTTAEDKVEVKFIIDDLFFFSRMI